MKKLLAILWSLLLIVTVYVLSDYFISSVNNKKSYEEIRVSFNALDTGFNYDTNLISQSEENIITERFRTLMEEVDNQDIVGWIKISDTAIDYPVVKTDNNDFYLENNIYKQPDNAGAIFMDFRNTGVFEEPHTIIYGHSMRNGSMFKDLLKYKNEDFFNNHPIIEYSTLYEDTQWEIFSVYVTSTDFYYLETNFPSDNDYQSFLNSIIEKSKFASEINVTAEDTILTLSTCAYDFDDARFVVHARKK